MIVLALTILLLLLLLAGSGFFKKTPLEKEKIYLIGSVLPLFLLFVASWISKHGAADGVFLFGICIISLALSLLLSVILLFLLGFGLIQRPGRKNKTRLILAAFIAGVPMIWYILLSIFKIKLLF